MHRSRWSMLVRIGVLLFLMSGCIVRERYQPPSQQPVSGGGQQPMRTGDVKSSTAYIQVVPPDELRQLFTQLSARPNLNPGLRMILLAYVSQQSSGSGFVLSGSRGNKSWVITNRHVVDDAGGARVSFDGGETLSNAQVVYVDDYYDLAVLEISNRPSGLSLRMDYADGQEVEALGYPGLNSKGSFQITRGNVSNACVKNSELFEDSGKCWLQHTAAIDPGSSGGPLVIHGGVIGVSTIVARGRNDAYFAVPAKAISEVIGRADEVHQKQGDRDWMTKQLQLSCQRLTSELSSSRPRIRTLFPLISLRLVSGSGLQAWGSIEDPDLDEVFKMDPYKGMQISLLMRLQAEVGASGGVLTSEKCQNINPSDDVLDSSRDVRIVIEYRRGHGEFFWRFERGLWRLVGF